MRSQQAVSQRRDDGSSGARQAEFAARDHTARKRLAMAAGVGISLTVALFLLSCNGTPTGVTSGGGGGGQGQPPPGWTPVQIGEQFQGTITGGDTLCTDSTDYYSPGVPCQKFALMLPGKAGVLTVQLVWNEPADQLELSIPGSWSECCASPLTHRVTVAAGPYVEAWVKLIGPKDPTGGAGQAIGQKFTLTTSFSSQ